MISSNKFYKVIITAPDGRFGIRVLEGGLTKKSAEFEAKKLKEMGMIVTVLPSTN